MKCYWCDEDIGVGDDYIYLDIENGLCFHEGCNEEYIRDITKIKTNDKDDWEE